MTPSWDFLIDEASLASVLPTEYSRFARPIRDGLSLFLGGLPESQQASILMAQAKLPADASFSQRLGLLAKSSPVLQKVGQILARDQRVPLELRRHLRELESLDPSIPLEIVRKRLVQELGDLDKLGITLQPAIAEASVAIVVPFQEKCLGNRFASRGVLKVLKPGIEQQLEHELNLLQRVGEHLDNRCEDLNIPQLDYEESFQQAQSKLLDEVLLENEQRHLVQAKKFFADQPRVQIPELLEHCTSRVTAMERISGGKVTSQAAGDIHAKRKLARLIADALIAKPVFSKSDQALFHGDPHAGNLFLTDDGRLGILDWSLAGRLGVTERTTIVQIILAAITLDARRMAYQLAQLADRQRLDESALQEVSENWVRRVRRGQIPGPSWLMGMLDEAVQVARLRVSTDLVLFRKSLLTLEGVVAEVGESRGQLETTLIVEFLRNFALEFPQRWLKMPDSREFSTRLSNLDITETLLSYPTTATSFLTGHAFDILKAFTTTRQKAKRSDVAFSGDGINRKL